MTRRPFKMLPSRHAYAERDGKRLMAGRASFVWVTYLQARIAGVPGEYRIRQGNDHPWHALHHTPDEAEQELRDWYGPRPHDARRAETVIRRCRRLRDHRAERGLAVA